MAEPRRPEEDTTEFHHLATMVSKFFVDQPRKVRVTVGAATHVGKTRTKNEDRYAIVKRTRSREVLATNVCLDHLTRVDAEAYCLVVADGMGGQAFGDFASQLAIQTVWEWAGRAASWIMKLRDLNSQQIHERVAAFAQVIQEAMHEHAAADPRLVGMGTTWTSAHIMDQDAVIAHVGDSRAYHYREGVARQITRDHTLAEELLAAGAAPEAVAKFRHVLTNAFCSDSKETSVDVHHIRLKDGDGLLVCSDGLADSVSRTEIASVLAAAADPQAACDALVQKALDAGGRDNITTLLGRLQVEPAEG